MAVTTYGSARTSRFTLYPGWTRQLDVVQKSFSCNLGESRLVLLRQDNYVRSPRVLVLGL
jgi:hypothetical protein